MQGLPVFVDTTEPNEIRELIKSNTRFEHLIENASPLYWTRREEIANSAYSDLKEGRSKR